MKEIELFPAICELYSKEEIFAEVPIYGKRPDVVIKSIDGKIVVIEMKTSLNKQVVNQAEYWLNKSHYVFVAVPKPVIKSRTNYLSRLLAEGVGVIYISEGKAEIHREARYKDISCYYENIWNKRLVSAFKDTIGGSDVSNGVLTMYKVMIQQIQKLMIKTRKEYTAQDLVKLVPEISEHYSDPVQSIRTALSNYESSWCKRSMRGQRAIFKAQIKRTAIKKKFENPD